MSRKISKLLDAHPHLAPLSGWHLSVALVIEQQHPSWMGDAQVGRYEKEVFLEIVRVSPVDGQRIYFSSTSGYRLTYGLGLWHGHKYTDEKRDDVYRNWYYPNIELALRDTFKILDNIIAESWIVVKRHDGGSQLCSLVWFEESDKSDVSLTNSWLGTYDKTYEHND
ncbi:MAG: hypothetical protein AAF125_04750 [Chloroflexota bacterium]